MKSIGFKNFRKFVDFPVMNFNDITLMVGRNNSGKSTLVKAILLVVNYLKNHQNQVFPFTTENINDVNIVSFDRARCKNQSDDIAFEFTFDVYHVKINISGDKHIINGNVDVLEITDRSKFITFIFNFKAHTVKISRGKDMDSKISELNNKIIDMAKEATQRTNLATDLVNNGTDIIEALRIADELNREKEMQDRQSKVISEVDSDIVYSVEYDININTSNSGFNLGEYVSRFIYENEKEKRLLTNKGLLSDEDKERLEDIGLIQESQSELSNAIYNFIHSINDHYMYYWSAETQKQSALFSIRDNNNALANAIHDFCGLNIQEGDEEYVFIQNQLKEFEVGIDFKLTPHVGEAYECDVKEESGVVISLADKGMGSIQLMTLFFRLASIIRKHKNQLMYDNEQITYNGGVTLIIEEPELNLHPILQEKLMVLFNYVMNKYRIKFIIETHSEYLIRKSQLIVVDNGYTAKIEGVDNMPISVYFFTSENKAENMQLGEDGKFEKDFEPGFINVADDAAVELFEKTV